ncbi:hypothetical protein [Winogradskyella endarachnes]|uniref:Uncharacterized protein n=1 Tax=Winogradskyella endarachnes TaxID=2681965 RepID=A0A6L6U7Z1_9FLAO|nr:hypothetical protein [Winogradskyella endarachnes]MUU78415.1 hypothetical protein [Winogradskyella endarachnes]
MKSLLKGLIVLSILLSYSCRETKEEEKGITEDKTEVVDETVIATEAVEDDLDEAEEYINETEKELEDALSDLDNI